MLDLALKATERSACNPLGFLGLFPASTVRLLWLSTIRLECAVIGHVQETKPYGWDEAFDHFVMDVIQARGFAVLEERYSISNVSDGER